MFQERIFRDVGMSDVVTIVVNANTHIKHALITITIVNDILCWTIVYSVDRHYGML